MASKMQQFWVFGYGSLMWRPGFAHLRAVPARLYGFHRQLCVYSHVHRGTPERPGLVLGLDKGGSCHGLAFEVASSNREATLAYLRAREQVTSVYREIFSPIRLLTDEAETVEAVAYVVDRGHEQYAGSLPVETQLAYVRQGKGQSGDCMDYVMSTLAHLREMDIHDRLLERLGQKLGGETHDT
ncbi:MAG: gamma-glutamylcyclotransferase [Rhizobiales bacterium]|nr:gamma-glutamylcyclotransferase [Hyphomicrobiales bacterium]